MGQVLVEGSPNAAKQRVGLECRIDHPRFSWRISPKYPFHPPFFYMLGTPLSPTVLTPGTYPSSHPVLTFIVPLTHIYVCMYLCVHSYILYGAPIKGPDLVTVATTSLSPCGDLKLMQKKKSVGRNMKSWLQLNGLWHLVSGQEKKPAARPKIQDSKGNIISKAVDLDKDKLERWKIKAE